MTDQPAPSPADDKDDVEFTVGEFVDGENRYRVIREKGEEDRWIASTYWLEWNGEELDAEDLI